MPAGTARFFSWLFAARAAREPLLGIYALTAEWRALMDSRSEREAALLKIHWWRDELRRCETGAPLHPITRYLAGLAAGAGVELAPLGRGLDAASAHIGGVPLERSGELESHADALYGAPLLAAARLAGSDGHAARACITALACAEYFARALVEYRRDARAGRIVFAVDELLAAGIDNEALSADHPPPRLRGYLEEINRRAAGHYAAAAQLLPPRERSLLRHLPVLAALGTAHANERQYGVAARFRPGDVFTAWRAARRAARAG